ncbi:MAG TPA: peptidoglycan DD-metalloendopeptidase family protein [Gemmatimonadales bacterium]
MRRWALALVIAFLVPPFPRLYAQDTTLERSQERLNEIRRERQQLQDDMDRLRGRVHSLSSELNNIEEQVALSGRAVGELDLQVTRMGSRIDSTTTDLILTEDGLAEQRARLQHRLTEITKRGSLYTFQVLLAAESFGDLVSRYKYLYLISRQDRQLLNNVAALRDTVASRRDGLLNLRSTLANRRDERAQENERLQDLQHQRQRSLHDSQREQARDQARLQQLARDEARLVDLIAAIDRRRRAAEAAAAAAAARAAPGRAPAPAATSRLRTSDLGQLDWPVNGDIVYSFGRQAGPGNTTIRWNGIGIAAPVGTAVHSVEAGTVSAVTQAGTYGLCVILDHDAGFYSLYCQLQSADVRTGQQIARGALIGRSGGANSDEGPHLHFEIRGDGGKQALDPVQWLRRRH